MLGSLFKRNVEVPVSMVAIPRELHNKIHQAKCGSCVCRDCKRFVCCRCQVCNKGTSPKSCCNEKQSLEIHVQYCTYY